MLAGWRVPDSWHDGARRRAQVNRYRVPDVDGFVARMRRGAFLRATATSRTHAPTRQVSRISRSLSSGCALRGPVGSSGLPESKQAQLLRRGSRRIEMAGRQPGPHLVEAELVAGDLETTADHPGHRPAAGHALAEGRVVVLAASGLADQLEH